MPNKTVTPSLSDDGDIKTQLNRETSKISWLELQKHYASGAVVAVTESMDLLKVAESFQQDNKRLVEGWLTEGSVFKVDDKQAKQWLENHAIVWAVVVAPWVLVQEVSANN